MLNIAYCFARESSPESDYNNRIKFLIAKLLKQES